MRWNGLLIAVVVLTIAGCGSGDEPSGTPEVKPYPLDTCLVSGEKLGSMGEPVRIVHNGQEIKFCCAGCQPEFEVDPEKFLSELK
jgi:hypothetical protein